MIIITLFFWGIVVLLLYLKYRIIFNGHKIGSEIVGHMRGARSTFGFVGYNYRVRFEYNDEIVYANSMQSTVGTDQSHSTKQVGEWHTIYYNPRYPKQIYINGFYSINLMIIGLFVVGSVGLLGELVFMVSNKSVMLLEIAHILA